MKEFKKLHFWGSVEGGPIHNVVDRYAYTTGDGAKVVDEKFTACNRTIRAKMSWAFGHGLTAKSYVPEQFCARCVKVSAR